VPIVPERAREVRQPGRIVVGHSETGHHHSIDHTDGVRFLLDPVDPLVCYLMLEGIAYADVVHHRSFDTHETLRLLATPGETTVFEVRRQREYREESQHRGHSWTAVRD
jgi:hypothetical protein